MIVDKISQLSLYSAAIPGLASAHAFVTAPATLGLAPGRYELEGGAYALIQEYTTDEPSAERKWEAHRRYLDVQCVLSGTEALGWTPLDQLVDAGDYNPDKDVLLATSAHESTEVVLRPGQFAVFLPGDAHRPCRSAERPVAVRKIVVKVPVARPR
jgi:YhcH/YjgK/YiaL family protein